MKMMLGIIFALCWQTSLALFFKPEPAKSNHLSVTFLKFSGLPLTEAEATNLGWKLFKDDCGDIKSPFLGKRYMLDGDRATIMIYDYSGNVAGMQMSYQASNAYSRRHRMHGAAIKYVDGYMYITAYFIEPTNVCNKKVKHKTSIGRKLVFLNGDKKYLKVPIVEKGIEGTAWVKGKCFHGMGQHYWYNISKNMVCDDMFPAFILYNKGKLNAFGFISDSNIQSGRVEHPPVWALGMFFKRDTRPKCLDRLPHRSTQHIYFKKVKWFNPHCFFG